jgi:hypothetical protein
MTRNGPERHGEVEWVDLGELSSSAAPVPDAPDIVAERMDAGSGRWSTRRLAVTAAVVVAALAAFALLDHDAGGPPQATRPPVAATPPPAAESPTEPALGADDQLSAPEPQVRRVGAHVLGVRDGWDLFGWGPSGVVRIELAAGRITLTPTPPLQSTGPVAVAAISDRVIVRPLDDVPGYAVPDGEPARPLAGALRGGGLLLPGPTPDLVWRATDDPLPSAVLTRPDGSETGTRATLPADGDGTVVADGDGYLLYLATDGVYDIRPAGVERLTAGWLVATGVGRVLVVECSEESRCSTVLVGLDDGVHRVVGPALSPTETLGQLSPDGRWAAVVVQSPGGRSRLETVDLRTGRVRPVALPAGPAVGSSGLVWSPDGTLFALDGAGHLQTVDPARATARSLGIALPAMSALTIRPAPG